MFLWNLLIRPFFVSDSSLGFLCFSSSVLLELFLICLELGAGLIGDRGLTLYSLVSLIRLIFLVTVLFLILLPCFLSFFFLIPEILRPILKCTSSVIGLETLHWLNICVRVILYFFACITERLIYKCGDLFCSFCFSNLVFFSFFWLADLVESQF